MLLDPTNTKIPDDWKEALGSSDQKTKEAYTEAYDSLISEAQGGDAESMHLVASTIKWVFHQSNLT